MPLNGISCVSIIALPGKLAKTSGATASKQVTAPNNFRIGTYSNGAKGQYFTHGQLSFACDA